MDWEQQGASNSTELHRTALNCTQRHRLAVAGMAEPPLRLAVGADAIDGIRAALESRPTALEKSAQRGRLAQQH
ncbi:hypothetical protein [Micromonospora sp. DT47]|uniref:hypothetical protein n=1 Tax=Micromonospora sp. DT47 TaxID=3393431 RepID=UPI003CEEC3B2